MKNLTKHLLYKGTDIGRQNVVWNIAGSFVYALASMVLSFLVIRVVGDGQHRPEYIEAMRQKMEEGYDIVIGSRFVTEKKGWSARMIGSRVIGSAIRLTTGTRVTDPTSGMRMFNRKMIEEFALNLNYGPEPDTVSFLIKQGARVAELQVTIDERTEGESYLKPLTAVHYMARMLISILMIQNFRKR